MSVAGLPTDRFCFEGFLPAKRSARRARLAELKAETRTLIFYEAVHRIAEAVSDLGEVFGAEREAFIGREISKLHEQCVFAPLATLSAKLAEGVIVAKGEFVLVVAGAEASGPVGGSQINSDALLTRLAAVMPHRQAVDIVAEVSGERRNAVYRRMLELTADNPVNDES